MNVVDASSDKHANGFSTNLTIKKSGTAENSSTYQQFPISQKISKLKVKELKLIDIYIDFLLSIEESDLTEDQFIERYNPNVYLSIYMGDEDTFTDITSVSDSDPEGDLETGGCFKVYQGEYKEHKNGLGYTIHGGKKFQCGIDVDILKSEHSIVTTDITLFFLIKTEEVVNNVVTEKKYILNSSIDLRFVGHRFFFSLNSCVDEKKLKNTFLSNCNILDSAHGTSTIRGICYGNGLFVAVGDIGKISTSPDGIDWTAQTGTFGTVTIRGICYGNGLFVAVGDGGNVSTSPDGINWTARTGAHGTSYIYGICYGNGLFVTVGADGKVSTSPDGINWTARTGAHGTSTIYRICYGINLYVAVGEGGKVSTSPDGINWTARTGAHGTSTIYDVCCGNGFHVAVGEGGKVSTSPDGINWTAQTGAHGTDHICSICYNNKLFVSGGYYNKISTSTNCINWTAILNDCAVENMAILDIYFDRGVFVIVGTGGKIMVSMRFPE